MRDDCGCVTGEKRHTSSARADDQFEREVSVLVAGQVEPGPAGEREAAADGHVATELVAPARSVWLGRAVRQPGAPPSRVPPPSPTAAPPPAAVPAPPTPAAAAVVAAAAATAAAAQQQLSPVFRGQHGGRGRADGRVGRGRVRAVRQDAPVAGARVAERERPRDGHGVRRGD